jgi:hypothetical protein
MKTLSWTSPLLAAVLIAGTGTRAYANLFSDDFEAVVVAEHEKDAPPDLCKPTSYVAFDGGYIEAGDPIAGENPPPAAQVRQCVAAAFASQGFQAVQSSPALVVIYHWGVLRVDHLEIRVPYEVRKNLSARLDLVATKEMYAEVENHILDRIKGSGQDMSASSPPFLVAPLDSVVAHARLPRIFVVVSAYDGAAMARHEVKLVWKAKLSAQETSGDMPEVIPPLLAKGAPYFGQSLKDVVLLKETLEKAPAATPDSEKTPPTPESYGLDKSLLTSLQKQEGGKISGRGDS